MTWMFRGPEVGKATLEVVFSFGDSSASEFADIGEDNLLLPGAARPECVCSFLPFTVSVSEGT